MEKGRDCTAGPCSGSGRALPRRTLRVEAWGLPRLSGCGDPGSFPEGFCGYYAQEQDGKLYVGFRFSAVFGSLVTGDFDVTIPVKGRINEVILKTGTNETSVWNAQTGLFSQSAQYGIYGKEIQK